MKNEAPKALRCLASENYRMTPTELITATALKLYLVSLVENGEEERAKAELKAAVKPKLLSIELPRTDLPGAGLSSAGLLDAEKAGITIADTGRIYPFVFDTLFDTPALTDLLDKAYRAIEKEMIGSSPLGTTIGEAMRSVDGQSAANNVGYAFTVFLVDCYKAVCGE